MEKQESTVLETQPTLASLVKSIESLEVIVEGWNDSQRLTVQALRKAIEDLHKEAFSRLIRGIKADPAAIPALRQAVGDEIVYAVLRHLGLLKPSLNERIERALASVRPLLQGHGGNVELVRVDPPDSVEIKLLGACDGCPASGLTLAEGIEKAIREHCPEIITIKKVKGIPPSSNVNGASVFFVSPFARSSDAGWQFAVELAEIPDIGIKVLELAGHSLLFSRTDQVVTCFENACAHMGMPLDMGLIADGVITCPYHGFRYDLSSGECLTAPEVQLVSHAVRVVGSKVEVKLRS